MYPKAQARFCTIVRMVALLKPIAVAMGMRSPRVRVMADACMATSVPVPMAMPISA